MAGKSNATVSRRFHAFRRCRFEEHHG
jgi:hypothetical protein